MLERWKHAFKLDPDRELSDESLERICLSGTDVVIVGGSAGVTFDNTIDLLSRIRRYEVDCVLEISAEDAVVPGFDYYLVPMVLNTEDARWITGHHQQAFRNLGHGFDWSRVLAEGYVILNERSTAARVTGAIAVTDEKDLVAYARVAERLMRLPIFYVEYSGAFGDMTLLSAVSRMLEHARLFYGGGIDTPDKARQAAVAGAHTVVVGNAVYGDLEQALATVAAVKGFQA